MNKLVNKCYLIYMEQIAYGTKLVIQKCFVIFRIYIAAMLLEHILVAHISASPLKIIIIFKMSVIFI